MSGSRLDQTLLSGSEDRHSEGSTAAILKWKSQWRKSHQSRGGKIKSWAKAGTFGQTSRNGFITLEQSNHSSSSKCFIVPFSFQYNNNPSSVRGCAAIKVGSIHTMSKHLSQRAISRHKSVQRAKSFRNLASLNVKILDNWWSLTSHFSSKVQDAI